MKCFERNILQCIITLNYIASGVKKAASHVIREVLKSFAKYCIISKPCELLRIETNMQTIKI